MIPWLKRDFAFAHLSHSCLVIVAITLLGSATTVQAGVHSDGFSSSRDDYATRHPDGKRLALVSEREGQFDLYLINVPK